MEKLRQFLNSAVVYKWLLFLNFLSGLAVFWIFHAETGSDMHTYVGLADGIRAGNYSYWYFISDAYPDTFRNPGYPLLLAFFRLFTHSLVPVQLFQLLLYFCSIGMVLNLIDKFWGALQIKNLFLLLLLPSIHVASYTPSVFPEIVVTFLLLVIIRIQYFGDKSKWSTYISSGLLYGILFQIRPVILFLPFLLAALGIVTERKAFPFVKNGVMLILFICTMIPYGMWNKSHHGTFKITSIEGGGGVFHLGYWSFKLPDYTENRYWGNYCPREMISFSDEKDRAANIAAYNAEWDLIDSLTAPYLTANDSAMIALQPKYPYLFKTFSSGYTQKREQLLKKLAIEHIKADPVYYAKEKIYSAIRLWVTGIPVKEFKSAGVARRMYLIYPFIITGLTFLAGLIFITMCFIKNKPYRKLMLPLLLITLYFGVMHIPFTIQSRYTIPVRFELLLMIAAAVYFLFPSLSAAKDPAKAG
ncbi:MAG TPA: hypothetical protein VFW78_04920 [Bacteroidia bacterium]|nr:hypothetical protein [Bacteroidia bacterium]